MRDAIDSEIDDTGITHFSEKPSHAVPIFDMLTWQQALLSELSVSFSRANCSGDEVSLALGAAVVGVRKPDLTVATCDFGGSI